jgi:hypothetical protein
VAVPTPACTMTIGGHPCGVREREGERGDGVASRRVEGCSRFRQQASLLCTIGREKGSGRCPHVVTKVGTRRERRSRWLGKGDRRGVQV